jgi:hypothetical protein
LDVTRRTLNNLVNGKNGIWADVAIRLDKAFGGAAETWLRLQMAYDLVQARQHEGEINIKPVMRRKLQSCAPEWLVRSCSRGYLHAKASRLKSEPKSARLVAGCRGTVSALRIPRGQPRNRAGLGVVKRMG